MSDPKLCPQCQAPIPLDAPGELCPACLLARDEEAFKKQQLVELNAAFPQFELIELLGRGGMGEVYKARHKQLNRVVAIKILPPPFGKDDGLTARFLREAQALASLNHPNIVTVHDFGETEGLCYFVMEFIDGTDLKRVIETKALTPARALAIVPQICDALQFAHDEGVVHRDIKPGNILLDKKGRVKVADFGLAKIVRAENLDPHLTLSGQTLGTPVYMAPEQREHPLDVDHRADIYSLGVVFYEMLTGEVPVGRFQLPSEKVQVDVRLDEVVLRSLEIQPERRYQHVSEVKTDVEHVNLTPAGAVTHPENAPGTARESMGPAAPKVADARLCPVALWGAIWGIVGGVALAPLLFLLGERPDGAFFVPPPWLKSPVAIVLGLIVLFAPLGTMLLGGISIGRIRRSKGRLYGLPLAVVDLLTFPLIAVSFFTAEGFFQMIDPQHPGWLFCGALLGIIFSILIARAVWRAVNRPHALAEQR